MSNGKFKFSTANEGTYWTGNSFLNEISATWYFYKRNLGTNKRNLLKWWLKISQNPMILVKLEKNQLQEIQGTGSNKYFTMEN